MSQFILHQNSDNIVTVDITDMLQDLPFNGASVTAQVTAFDRTLLMPETAMTEESPGSYSLNVPASALTKLGKVSITVTATKNGFQRFERFSGHIG